MHVPTRTSQHSCEGCRAGDNVPTSEGRAVRLLPDSPSDPGLKPRSVHPKSCFSVLRPSCLLKTR